MVAVPHRHQANEKDIPSNKKIGVYLFIYLILFLCSCNKIYIFSAITRAILIYIFWPSTIFECFFKSDTSSLNSNQGLCSNGTETAIGIQTL